MIDRVTALEALIAKVEAGEWDHSPNGVARAVFPYKSAAIDDLGLTAVEAFNGSLDAAKALYEAVLPGSDWFVRMHTAAPSVGRWHVTLIPHQNNRSRMRDVGPEIGDPARAWLLAIIRALLEQERGA